MKLIAVYGQNNKENRDNLFTPVWPDSALIRTGKPIFLPDDCNYFVHVALGARIDAVGKSISRKFARKYYEDFLPVCLILNEETSEAFAGQTEAGASGLVADYSVIIGEGAELPENSKVEEIELSLSSLYGDNNINLRIKTENIQDLVDTAISRASGRNTLKTGDYVCALLPGRLPATRDMLLRVSIGSGRPLIESKLK